MNTRDGCALVGALLALALSTMFAATMAGLGATELRIANNERRALTALAALDACAAHVLRDLPLGWSFDGAMLGPDGTPGTTDDGTLQAPTPCRASATLLPGATPRLRATLGTTAGGGTRSGDAVIGRAGHPGPPALLWTTDGTALGAITGDLLLDGTDPGGRAPWASIGAPADPPVLDAWLANEPVDVAPGTNPPIWTPPAEIAAIVDAARAAGAPPPAVTFTSSPPATAALTLADADLAVPGAAWARGLVVINGRVIVSGALEIDGLLVVRGPIEVASGGTVQIRGAVWSDTGGAPALEVPGSLAITRHLANLTDAANFLTLPHEPRMRSWRDH